MYENERYGAAPFGRDPRSLPLYVPPEDHLPLWPAAWRGRVLLAVAAAGALGLAGLRRRRHLALRPARLSRNGARGSESVPRARVPPSGARNRG
jgi:hypothetical protein